MDKATQRLIDQAIDGFGSSVDGRHYLDGVSSAVYRIEPPGSECVALACLVCKTVTIRPGTPRLEHLAMACSSCGLNWELAPPPEVVAFGRSGLQVVGFDTAPGSPSRPS